MVLTSAATIHSYDRGLVFYSTWIIPESPSNHETKFIELAVLKHDNKPVAGSACHGDSNVDKWLAAIANMQPPYPG